MNRDFDRAPVRLPTYPSVFNFSPRKDLLKQLLDLNLKVANRIDQGEHVTAPGIPPDFPNRSPELVEGPKSLITNDCIRPAK